MRVVRFRWVSESQAPVGLSNWISREQAVSRNKLLMILTSKSGVQLRCLKGGGHAPCGSRRLINLARTTLIGRRRLSILNTTGRSAPHPEPCGQSSGRFGQAIDPAASSNRQEQVGSLENNPTLAIPRITAKGCKHGRRRLQFHRSECVPGLLRCPPSILTRRDYCRQH